MATSLEEVWRLFREVAEAQKETDRKFQETDRKFQETDRKFQETERLLKERAQETETHFQETERFLKSLLEAQSQELTRRMRETDRQLGRLGNRLGEFVEGLVKPALVKLFQARGIAVHEVYSDVEVNRPPEGMQIDLLVINSNDAVLVEVKSKLTQMDVQEHLDRLEKFKRLMPRYADMRAMGAVAAMVVPSEVARYAYQQGLFVLAQSGDGVVIMNDAAFQPRTW